MNDLTFIPDGYTLDFSIPAEPGVHGPLAGTYREVTSEEFAAYRAARQTVKDPEALFVRLLSGHVKTWDAEHPVTGTPIEISEDNMRRMQNLLLQKLTKIVCGEGDRGNTGLIAERNGDETSAEVAAKNLPRG